GIHAELSFDARSHFGNASNQRLRRFGTFKSKYLATSMEDIVHADLFQTLHALTFANSEQASFARDSPTQHEMTLPVRAPVAGPVDRGHDGHTTCAYRRS